MAKMWAGRTAGTTDQLADDFNSSIGFDSRMYREDITGSIAHAEMLAATGIIDAAEAARIVKGLEGILNDLDSGTLTPVLKKLEEKGYLTRHRLPEDERNLCVEITDEGMALREKALTVPQRMAASCAQLSPEEARALYGLLYKLLDKYQG